MNYKVPFLSTKLRYVAKKHGLENELDNSLRKQKAIRNKNANQPVKGVLQFDLDGNFIKEFKSISDASRELNISSGAISNAIIGRTKSCKGFLWKLK